MKIKNFKKKMNKKRFTVLATSALFLAGIFVVVGCDTGTGNGEDVIKDTVAPVIEGAQNFSVYIGETVSYKAGVTASDNVDEKVSVKVDKSQVNPEEPGVYPLTYMAEDKAGNKTSVTVNIEFLVPDYTEQEIYELAQKVLDEIIKEDMSQRDILETIYHWTRDNIAYVGYSDKTDWLKTAHQGFSQRKGDCYTNACVAKALLTCAGIENKDIEKIPAETRHYWNLVNIGEGWYHFDTTPRQKQNISFCYISDADLMAYSVTDDNSHNYDKSIYTDIQ